jgi:hypothetical protein
VPAPATDVRLFPATLAAELEKDPAALYAECDDSLGKNVSLGSYQASQLVWCRKYALAAQHAKKQGDMVRWDKYCRKAEAIGKGGCRNYQKGGWELRQCFGIGDGVQTRFPLPKTPIVPSVSVFLSTVTTKTVTRGLPGMGDVDDVDYYNLFLKVTQNATEYVRGVDWDRQMCGNNRIHWIGNRPAQLSTYTVHEAQIISPTRASGWSVQGNDIVFATPPAAGQAVIVEAVYTDYSQTEALDGGYSNIVVDTGYATRSLKWIPFVLDWCRGHAVVEAARAEIEAQLVVWADEIIKPNVGYLAGSIQSNYGVGHYAMRAYIALALNNQRLKDEVWAFRMNTLIPQMSGPAPSLRGGWWAEGWGYGELGAMGILETAKALVEGGLILPDPDEFRWADEVRANLATSRFGGGDYFSYPPTDAPELRALLSPLPAPSSLHIAEGAGLTVVRGPDMEASILAGNLLIADHQQYAPGHGEILRGNDRLVISANNITRNQTIQKTPESNTLCLNDPGLHNYPFSMGVWYGFPPGPGIVQVGRQETADWHFFAFEGKAAWSKNTAPGAGGPCVSWVRYWLAHRTLGFVVTMDKVRTLNPTCYRDVRWHLAPGAATQALNRVVADRGASRVQITGLSDGPLDVQLGALNTIPQVKLVGSADRTDFSIVSVVQTGPAGAALPIPTAIAGGADVGGTRVVFSGAGVTVG